MIAESRGDRYRLLFRSLACLTILATAGDRARADVIRFAYTGTITSADPSTGVAAGTPFSGTFAYDPLFKLQGPSYEGNTQYISGAAAGIPGSIPDASGLTVDVGGKSVYSHTGGIDVAVFNIRYAGEYGYHYNPSTDLSISNTNIGDFPFAVFLEFINYSRSVYPALDSPTKISLPDFPSSILSIYAPAVGGASPLLYAGRIETLTAIEAPEPSTAILLGVAVVAGLFRARRTRPA